MHVTNPTIHFIVIIYINLCPFMKLRIERRANISLYWLLYSLSYLTLMILLICFFYVLSTAVIFLLQYNFAFTHLFGVILEYIIFLYVIEPTSQLVTYGLYNCSLNKK